MLNPIEGEIFCIDKPLRMTSFAAVKKVRAVLRTHLKTRQVKVGHADVACQGADVGSLTAHDADL